MEKTGDDLLLFEAIELRNIYDRKIGLLKGIVSVRGGGADFFSARSDADKKDYDDDFNLEKTEKDLKSLETRRVKLNQAIQKANFTAALSFKGDEISIAEALEVRKGLLTDLDAVAEKVKKSAFKEIVHKEERDIEHRPQHRFPDVYGEFNEKLEELRRLAGAIHRANHQVTVQFKDEA
jgi:hypothetical protein